MEDAVKVPKPCQIMEGLKDEINGLAAVRPMDRSLRASTDCTREVQDE
jgi:hypothetical protein